VLVKEQNGAPLPKIIDFGIAKATGRWAVENTLMTQFGQMVGTPEYASPEQADVMTGAVGEASDVYSLGVLWYETADDTEVPAARGKERLEAKRCLEERAHRGLCASRMRANHAC